jgi:predicted RND superfamily exporter protein
LHSLRPQFINLNLLGMMSMWDVRLNVASLVILILSVGFSVDYSAHIAEVSSRGRAERAGAGGGFGGSPPDNPPP